VFIINLYYTGSLFVSNSFKIAFATSYGDTFSAVRDLSLQSYLSWGLKNILLSKITIIPNNIIETFKAFGRDIIVIPVIGLFAILFPRTLRFNWREFYPIPLFAIILIGFYTFIATFTSLGGALFRSAMAIVPFVIVIAIKAIMRVSPRSIIMHLIMIVILAAAIYGSVRLSSNLVFLAGQMDYELKLIPPVLESIHTTDDEIVILTGIPSELSYTTGYRTLRLADDDLESIYMIAQKYKANFLILPAPGKVPEKLYNGEISDPRLKFIQTIDSTDFKIYKIVF
jgi:hypothetical protein